MLSRGFVVADMPLECMPDPCPPPPALPQVSWQVAMQLPSVKAAYATHARLLDDFALQPYTSLGTLSALLFPHLLVVACAWVCLANLPCDVQAMAASNRLQIPQEVCDVPSRAAGPCVRRATGRGGRLGRRERLMQSSGCVRAGGGPGAVGGGGGHATWAKREATPPPL